MGLYLERDSQVREPVFRNAIMLSDCKGILSMRQSVDRNPAVPVYRMPFFPRAERILHLQIFFQPKKWSRNVYNNLVEIRFNPLSHPGIEPQRINEEIIHENCLVGHLRMQAVGIEIYDPIKRREIKVSVIVRLRRRITPAVKLIGIKPG